MKTLLKLAKWAETAPIALAALALMILMVMTFFDVLLRSSLNAPIEAATELTRILVAIVVFATLPVVSARGGHIVVDLLDRYFGPRAGTIRDGVLSLICGAALYWPLKQLVVLAERARSYGDVTEYLSIPQFYVGWGIAASIALTAVLLVARGLALLLAPKALEEDGHV